MAGALAAFGTLPLNAPFVTSPILDFHEARRFCAKFINLLAMHGLTHQQSESLSMLASWNMTNPKPR